MQVHFDSLGTYLSDDWLLCKLDDMVPVGLGGLDMC